MNTELALQMLAELRAIRALLEPKVVIPFKEAVEVVAPPKKGWPKGKPRARKAK